jgi:hypothetical protein
LAEAGLLTAMIGEQLATRAKALANRCVTTGLSGQHSGQSFHLMNAMTDGLDLIAVAELELLSTWLHATADALQRLCGKKLQTVLGVSMSLQKKI